MLEIVYTCPLGHTCEEIKDNKIHRCRWYNTEIEGMNPQTGETIKEYRCDISWGPILAVENARTNRGQTAALESFRNQVILQTNRLNHAD